jgi:predicted ester cyclase
MTAQPLKDSDEGHGGEIDLHSKGDISRMLAPDQPRRQSMAGFDPVYADIVDYIVQITHRIWEEKEIGLIYDTYVHNVSVWTTEGLSYGREAVIASTIRTLAACPDVRLFANEVIWSGNDRDGFHTSHRIVWVGRNTGYSIYGSPTGRRILRTGIANCFVKENRIMEEWIVRDELALVQQLGIDPLAAAARLGSQGGGEAQRETGELERIKGQGTPPVMPPKAGDDFDVEDFVRRSYHEIWDWRRLNKIDQYCSPGYVCHTVPVRKLTGRGDYKAHLLGLMAVFPDATLTIDEVYWMEDAQRGYKTMTRWTLQGTHLGPGPYGRPTGRRVRLMGISHHRIQDGKFIEEWMIYDEFALLKQLYSSPPVKDENQE